MCRDNNVDASMFVVFDSELSQGLAVASGHVDFYVTLELMHVDGDLGFR
jgi:hypothetical protein